MIHNVKNHSKDLQIISSSVNIPKNVESVKTFTKWRTVFGLFMLVFPLCTIWMWGNMSTYLNSYALKHIGQASVIYGPWMPAGYEIGFLQGWFASAYLSASNGRGLTILCGFSIFSIGILLCYLLMGSSLLALHIVLGIFSGLGLYITDGVVTEITIDLCQDDFGFVYGLTQSGIPIGAFVINQILTAYVNPNNLLPGIKIGPSHFYSQDEVLDRVPNIFLILTAVTIVCYILAMIIIGKNIYPLTKPATVTTTCSESQPPSTCDLCETNQEIKKVKFVEETTSFYEYSSDYSSIILGLSSAFPGVTPREALRDWKLYCFAFIAILGMSTFMVITPNYKTYGQTYIKDDHFLTYNSMVFLIFLSISRPVWGKFMDWFGLEISLVVYFTFCTLGSLTFYASPFLNKWVYMAATILFVCAANPIYLLGAYACMVTFGDRHFLINYGLMYTPQSLLSALISFGLENLLEHFGWFALFASCALWNFIGLMVCAIAFKFKHLD